MAEVHWGDDGRTHRVGFNGQTLCRTMIDYSRPSEERAISGCSVCDIVQMDVDSSGHAGTNRALVFGVVIAVLVGVLFVLALLSG